MCMKTMKTYPMAALLAAFALPLTLPFGSVSASPLISIGDNADVFFNGSSSLRSTSNVYRSENNRKNDQILILSPGLELNVGRGASNVDLSLITRYDIVRYNDQSRLDTELFHIKAIGSYRSSRLDLNGLISFDESKTSTGDNAIVDDLIEFDTFVASLNLEYRFSPKFSFGAGVRYREVDYKTYTEYFADRETISFPLDLFYELTPRIDLSVGYTYSETEVDSLVTPLFPGAPLANSVGSYKQKSHFFNVGARGELMPKLNGSFKVGYRARSVGDSSTELVMFPSGVLIPGSEGKRTRSDSGMLGLEADLRWSATPKLTTTLGLSRDFDVGSEGQSNENTSVNLGASYSINSQWAASGNFGYTLRDFSNSGRKDHHYRSGLRLMYSLNQYWNFSGGYTYTENDSNRENRSFRDHTFDLTASLRY
ncbi:MAG: hypothetical protein EA353_11220 [Puniceicoccaceae bacterium]|nr:MAG: hypothetical protein EA353_11220 [Puniceicoccaceae bacterium]